MNKFSDFVVGQKYHTIVGTVNNAYTCLYSDEFTAMMGGGNHKDDRRVVHHPKNWVEVPKLKKTGTFYTNLYLLDNGRISKSVPHDTKEEADEAASYSSNRVACVETTWTEGDGL